MVVTLHLECFLDVITQPGLSGEMPSASHGTHTPLNCTALVNAAEAFMCHVKSCPRVSWIQKTVTGPEGAATVIPAHSLSPSNYFFSNGSLVQSAIHHTNPLLGAFLFPSSHIQGSPRERSEDLAVFCPREKERVVCNGRLCNTCRDGPVPGHLCTLHPEVVPRR